MSRKSSKFVKFNAAALAILASVLLGSGAASAKDRKPKGSDNNQAHVVGHISFAGLSAIDMAMQNNLNGRGYAVQENQQNAKDLSTLVGRLCQTIAVFYVLHAPILTQDLFFENQRRAARRATHWKGVSRINVDVTEGCENPEA